MREPEVRKAMVEIADGLKCVLEAQLGERPKNTCVVPLKVPVKRFCDIARRTEKRFKKEDPDYSIATFAGGHVAQMKVMGTICSSRDGFESCDQAQTEYEANFGRPYNEQRDEKRRACENEIVSGIREAPIEKSVSYDRNLRAFETMRNHMHVSGYFTPDYVWVVPKRMRSEVKTFFEKLSSSEIRSPEDLERIIRGIR